MISDARHIPNGTTLTADLCIVGAGAAGISLALALADSGLDILLLESGGDRFESATQELYAGSVADSHLHTAPDRYRVRRYGGSTTLWGGRCMPLDAIDFECRDYMANSGWPISLDDLLPYYPRANQLCEAGKFAYTVETAFDRPVRPMIGGFESDVFASNTLERFSCPTDFGKRYRQQLMRSPVRLLEHANLCELPVVDNGRLAGSGVVRTLAGTQFTVNARTYVLATGGLEVARMLLANPGASGRGLGNAHDIVGRYYMCHIAGTMGIVDLAQATSVYHGYEISDEGVYCRRRLSLRPQAQRALRAGNFIARLHHPRIPDPGHGSGILSALYLARPFIPYEYGKRLYGDQPAELGNTLAHMRNVIMDAPSTATFLWHWLWRHTLAERKFPSIIVRPKNRRFSLDFHAEQEPNRESRILLSDDVDALGVPRLKIDWHYSPQDVHTVSAALKALADALHRTGVGHFEYDPAQVEAEMTRYGAYGGHHIGTARMGKDPRTSVVNAQCQLHETENVYIASSAVFPTSSQANPTLTIVAMALRLADHLRKTCRELPARHLESHS